MNMDRYLSKPLRYAVLPDHLVGSVATTTALCLTFPQLGDGSRFYWMARHARLAGRLRAKGNIAAADHWRAEALATLTPKATP